MVYSHILTSSRTYRGDPWILLLRCDLRKDPVDRERFAELNIHGCSAIEVFTEYFCIALAMSAHYLVQLKRSTYIHGKTFMVRLKIVKM